MKVLGLLCIVGLAVALPTPPKLSEPDECSKECISGVAQYGQELSILKNSDLSNYFNKINEICEVITTARKCLESCGSASNNGPSNNPFALESLNIVCQPETQEKIESIKQCLHYIDSNVHEICSKECSSDHIIDETDVKEEQNPMYKKANGECATFKCMARCNVETVSTQCGKDLGKEFQGLLQQVVDTQRKDLENLKLVDIMAKTSPPECNYLYDPSVLFGGKTEESTTPAAAVVHDPKEDAKSLYAQAQLQLLLKQLELTEKQDALIDRENAKLDMEMSYMAHKAEQRERGFHAAQHAIATFVPMEKMPKEHMPMETMEHGHGEAMPAEGHPEEVQPPMEEGHAQQQQQPEQPSHPEEPHPEQMESHPPMEGHPEQHMPMEAHPPMEDSHPQPMPSMEPHQPPMPMEAHPPMPMELPHPPMDFPNPPEAMHGMPFEIMIPEMARQHPKSSRHMPPPMILEGVPMEFVPMDGAPIDLSLDMPMMRAPRFL